MCCEQFIRAFSHCPIDHINVAVRRRNISQMTMASGTAHSFIDLDILDEAKDQGDRDPFTHQINWCERWKYLKLHATALVDNLSLTTPQDHAVSEDLAPVYIAGWKPYDISGQSKDMAGGPTPPKAYNQYQHSGRKRAASRSASPYDRRGGHSKSPTRSQQTNTYNTSTRNRQGADDLYPYDPNQRNPPTLTQYTYWYGQKSSRCLACGGTQSQQGHSSFATCPIRTKYFPSFSPDWQRLKKQQLNVTEVVDLAAAPAQTAPLGSKYPHRDDSNRSHRSDATGDRSYRPADRDRSQSRGRDNQQERGRTPYRQDYRRDDSRSQSRHRADQQTPTDAVTTEPQSGKE